MYDVGIIGGGPAGTLAAIKAAGRGLQVLLLDRQAYPRHKVCGEFVSAEAIGLLQEVLGNQIDVLLQAPRIGFAQLSSGHTEVRFPIEPAGYSITRFQLDQVLWENAGNLGVECRTQTVHHVINRNDAGFEIVTADGEHIPARAVINAAGRWSELSHRRDGGSPWLGIKAHFAGELDQCVYLHFTDVGYCGLQPVAPGTINVCALVRAGTVRSLRQLFATDAKLRSRLRGWQQITPTFASGGIYLLPAQPVQSGIFQAGDAAGFIDPYTGDGIALAIRSGVLAGSMVGGASAAQYAAVYHTHFDRIFRNSRSLHALLPRPGWRSLTLNALRLPSISSLLFRGTRQHEQR